MTSNKLKNKKIIENMKNYMLSYSINMMTNIFFNNWLTNVYIINNKLNWPIIYNSTDNYISMISFYIINFQRMRRNKWML